MIMSPISARLTLLLITTVLSLVAVEVYLWWVEPPEHPDASPTGTFVQHSVVLGWEPKPSITGHYASNRCYGEVGFDTDGIRLNGPDGGGRPGYRNILFIGDSNTVALEVSDNQTTPALLEQGLRARGLRANVLNLGVRGYGTDQSVVRALQYAEVHQPEQIVYMYTDNDIYENNVTREIGRRFGKGVYLRREGSFEPVGLPVPRYDPQHFGMVVLDPFGRPVVYESAHPPVQRIRPLGWLDRTWRLYRRLADLRVSRLDRQIRYWKTQYADPFEVMNTDGLDAVDVFLALFYGLSDGGRARIDHSDYYNAQFEFLLGRLWEIPSLRRIHLVEFPNLPTMEILAEGGHSTNVELFEGLVAEDRVQSLVSLSRAMHEQGLEYDDFSCRPGGHFGEQGHRWISEVLLERLDFDVGEAESRL